MSTSARDRKARRREFAQNVRDANGEVRTHGEHGWTYLFDDALVAVPEEDSAKRDDRNQAVLYWAFRDDVWFVEIAPQWDDGPEPGIHIDAGFGPHDHPRMVVITRGDPVTTELVEGAMAMAASKLPRRVGPGPLRRL